MYYMLNNFVFVRSVNNHLQLCDKRSDEKIIGDYSAYLFLKDLDYYPKSFDCIISNILSYFKNVNEDRIRDDAVQLYKNLSSQSLLSFGSSYEDCMNNALQFSYENTLENFVFLKHNLGKLIEFRNSISDKPVLQTVIIEITKICNERCIHCYIPHNDKTVMMRSRDFYKIIDECVGMKSVFEIKITGGECMTHPNFKDFIRYIKKKNFSLGIMTNLTLLDDETIKICKEGTITFIQVSLFSLNPTIHDRITNMQGSLLLTLNNLKKLRDANIPVSIATQVMEDNKNDIKDLFIYAKENNFQFFCDWEIIARSDGNKENLSHRVSNVSDLYMQLCKLRMKYDENYKDDFITQLKAPLKSSNSYLCNAGMNTLHIGADLSVYPCSGWGLNVGSLSQNTLSDIWSSSITLNKIRKITLSDFKRCVKCTNRNICHICMAQAYNEGADLSNLQMSEYTCSVYSAIRSAAES